MTQRDEGQGRIRLSRGSEYRLKMAEMELDRRQLKLLAFDRPHQWPCSVEGNYQTLVSHAISCASKFVWC